MSISLRQVNRDCTGLKTLVANRLFQRGFLAMISREYRKKEMIIKLLMDRLRSRCLWLVINGADLFDHAILRQESV